MSNLYEQGYREMLNNETASLKVPAWTSTNLEVSKSTFNGIEKGQKVFIRTKRAIYYCAIVITVSSTQLSVRYVSRSAPDKSEIKLETDIIKLEEVIDIKIHEE